MRKRTDLNLKEKLKLLEKYDALEANLSQRAAAARLGIPQSSLSDLLKKRENLEAAELRNENLSRKRQRAGNHEDVDNVTSQWFAKVRKQDAMLNGPLIKAKAKSFAEKLGVQDFTASDGWFSRWKKRENIVYSKLHGEGASAETEAADNWMKNVWPKLHAEYDAKDIFNADETALYFRALPEHTFIFKKEHLNGFKKFKERLTLLCCVSMVGEKKGLLAIGKSQKPRCFKNIKKLPLEYKASANAWMTTNIFSDWLIQWNRHLKKQNRKVLLLVDNCKPHESLPPVTQIKVVFLPPNTTSVIQPCDQGIIKSFKSHYRQEICRTILNQMDNGVFKSNELAKKITVLSALHMAAKSWDKVSEKTIKNCFKKGGFISNETENASDENIESDANFYLPPFVMQQQFEEWNAIDDNVPATGEGDEDLLLPYLEEQNEEEYEDDNLDELTTIPTNGEILHAVEVLKSAVMHFSSEFEIQYNYENFIMNILHKNMKQTKIDDYFKKE